MKHTLIITPSIDPETRHLIEKTLEQAGYEVYGGGQFIDNSQSSLSFTSRNQPTTPDIRPVKDQHWK